MSDLLEKLARDTDILCPLCDYNLRGLEKANCPECGATFDWEELRNPARRKHPYLYEHYTDNQFRSFFRTLIGGLSPSRFWKSVSPVQHSRPHRLVDYWVCCVLLGTIGFFAQFGANYYQLYSWVENQRTQMKLYFGSGYMQGGVTHRASSAEITAVVQRDGSVQAFIDRTIPRPRLPDRITVASGFAEWTGTGVSSTSARDPIIASNLLDELVMLLWPWCAMPVMLILRAMTGRPQLRTIRLFRVAIYCGDLVVWMGVAWLFVSGILFMQSLLNNGSLARRASSPWADQMVVVIPALATMILTYRLGIALRKYLRFRNGMAMAISVQGQVVLIPVVIILLWTLVRQLLLW